VLLVTLAAVVAVAIFVTLNLPRMRRSQARTPETSSRDGVS
jgi:hypothetical protein